MSIQVTCEKCGAVLKVKNEFAGTKGKCPTCKGMLNVPTLEEEAARKAGDANAQDSDPELKTPRASSSTTGSSRTKQPDAKPSVAEVPVPEPEAPAPVKKKPVSESGKMPVVPEPAAKETKAEDRGNKGSAARESQPSTDAPASGSRRPRPSESSGAGDKSSLAAAIAAAMGEVEEDKPRSRRPSSRPAAEVQKPEPPAEEPPPAEPPRLEQAAPEPADEPDVSDETEGEAAAPSAADIAALFAAGAAEAKARAAARAAEQAAAELAEAEKEARAAAEAEAALDDGSDALADAIPDEDEPAAGAAAAESGGEFDPDSFLTDSPAAGKKPVAGSPGAGAAPGKGAGASRPGASGRSASRGAGASDSSFDEETLIPGPGDTLSPPNKRGGARDKAASEPVGAEKTAANARELLERAAKLAKAGGEDNPYKPKEKVPLRRVMGGLFRAYKWHMLGVLLLAACLFPLSSFLLRDKLDLPQLAQVTGTVLVGKKPLAGVEVQFFPIGGRATKQSDKQKTADNRPPRVATGVTDSNGQFVLSYLDGVPGCVLGQSRVCVLPLNPADASKIPLAYQDSSTSQLIQEVREANRPLTFDLE